MHEAERLVTELRDAMIALDAVGDEASVRLTELALVTLAGPAITSQRHLRALEGPLRSMISAGDTTGLELLAAQLLIVAGETQNDTLQGRVHELLRGHAHEGIVLAVESRLFGFALWHTERGELEAADQVAMTLAALAATMGHFSAGAAAMHALAWIHVAAGRPELSAQCAAQEARYRLRAGDHEAAAQAALAASRIEGVDVDELLVQLASQLEDGETSTLVAELLEAAGTRLMTAGRHKKALRTLLKGAEVAGGLDAPTTEARLYRAAADAHEHLGATAAARSCRARADLLTD